MGISTRHLSYSGNFTVSPTEMNDKDPLTLSEISLARLLGDALHVGVSAAPPEAPEWWQDDAFPYVPVSFVGRGGSGFVWKASRRDGRGFVALKLVPFRSDPIRLQQRWQDECASLRKIQHPNLVALVDHGRSPDNLSGWLAMEWIEGTCLGRKLAAEGKIPFKEILLIVPQAVAGLTALHAAGFVHRDIKPSNLLLETETGRLVIADLGIAHDLAGDPDQRVTRTFEQALTPGYFPPELLKPGYRPEARGDQYSLAFSFWQLLTGTMPLGAFAKLHHLCKCPDALDAVFRKALATDPTDRYPDLATFGQAFQQAATRPSRSVYLGALVVLCALAAAVFFFVRPAPFPKQFDSGPIPVNQGRHQFIRIHSTLQKDGLLRMKIRTTNLDYLFGFDRRVQLLLRDKNGVIIHEIETHSYGVNGRLLPGATYDRVDDTQQRIPAEIAIRVATIDYTAASSPETLNEKIYDGRETLNKGFREIKSGFSRGIDLLSDMFTITDTPPPKSDNGTVPASLPEKSTD